MSRYERAMRFGRQKESEKFSDGDISLGLRKGALKVFLGKFKGASTTEAIVFYENNFCNPFANNGDSHQGETSCPNTSISGRIQEREEGLVTAEQHDPNWDPNFPRLRQLLVILADSLKISPFRTKRIPPTQRGTSLGLN